MHERPGDEVIIAEWEKGTSTAAIGRMIGRTKNSIVGRVHRLIDAGVLSANRPSPIRSSGPRAIKPKAVKKEPTLPQLPSVASVGSVAPAPSPPPISVALHDRGGPRPQGAAQFQMAQIKSSSKPSPQALRASAAGRQAGVPSPFDNLAFRPVVKTEPVPSVTRTTRTCQFILDEGPWIGREPKWCGKPSAHGSYCQTHADACFVRVRDRREDYAVPKPVNAGGARGPGFWS